MNNSDPFGWLNDAIEEIKRESSKNTKEKPVIKSNAGTKLRVKKVVEFYGDNYEVVFTANIPIQNKEMAKEILELAIKDLAKSKIK